MRPSLIFLLVVVITGLSITVRAQDAATSEEAMKKRPFTVSCELRAGYDDNIFTSNINKQGSFTTAIVPSILVNYPMRQTLLSMRYTFNATYFESRPGQSYDLNHEFVGRINHSFSSRFNLDVRDRFRYGYEPQLFDSALTLFRSGEYINNTGTIQFNAQWERKFGTVTSYTNDIIAYQDSVIAFNQNRMAHSLNHDFRFLILPTVTFVAGGMYENVAYEQSPRSYQNFVGNIGVDWSVTPQLTIGGRIGGAITDLDGANGTYTSPYGTITMNWVLGARSSLDATYTHSVSQTDVAFAYAQESDTLTMAFKYQVTPRIYTRVLGLISYGQYDNELLLGLPGFGGVTVANSFKEWVAQADLAAGYKLDENISFEAGYNYTIVDSEFSARDYDRNRVYISVRGTY
jgi:hypothetical protein